MGADQSCCSKRSESKMQSRSISKVPKDDVLSAVAFRTISKEEARGAVKAAPENGTKAEKVGIGAYFQKSKSDPNGLAVKSLLTGSPAQKCDKIFVGDIILEVDGGNVYGKKLAELAEVLLGPPGSKVKLLFRSESTGDKYTVVLERGIPGYN
mmetsp:Transcript_49329/g.77065  ORF Transcript_49329/g.77065 Transcript_49329/m.77065 type:complete len:153 (-) Transcript_49329:826-1284(-)